MHKKVWVCLFLCFSLCGCGVNYYGRGKLFLEEENYDRATENLQQAVTQNPQKAENWQELGIAYYKRGELDKALGALKQANLIKRTQTSIFYFGLVYEKKEDMDSAINAYKGYMLLKPKGKMEKEMAKKVESRLKILQNRKIQEEVRKALEKEKSLEVAQIHPNTIAVTYFNPSGLDSSLVVLSKGLAEFLTTDLFKVKKLKVVERLRVERLLEELEFGRTQYVDKSTAPRVGRLLGACQLVTGSMLSVGGEKLRIDAALVLTQTGEISLSPEATIQKRLADLGYYKGKIDGIIGPSTKDAIKAFQKDHGLKEDGIAGPKTQEEFEKTYRNRDIEIVPEVSKTGELKQFFNMEKELVFGIIEKMGVELTKEERDKIKKVPTESFLAILAFSRGLDYIDRGMYPEAEFEFGKAKSEDPNFQEALNQYQGVKNLLEHRTSVEDLSNFESAYEKSEKEKKETSDALGGRLSETNENSSLIQDPSEDNPYTPAATPQTGTVIIQGDLHKK